MTRERGDTGSKLGALGRAPWALNSGGRGEQRQAADMRTQVQRHVCTIKKQASLLEMHLLSNFYNQLRCHGNHMYTMKGEGRELKTLTVHVRECSHLQRPGQRTGFPEAGQRGDGESPLVGSGN